MTKTETKPLQDAAQDGDTTQVRQCLRCDTAFSSEWSGERNCPRCKRSSTWRTGTTARPGPTSRSR